MGSDGAARAVLTPQVTPNRIPRQPVRHRAKLVGLRSSLKNQIHAVLAAAGVAVPMSDLFGPGGQQLLAGTRLAVESRSRVDSLLRVIEVLDFEIDTFARLVTGRLRADPGYAAIQQIPGVGPLLGAVFVAEIGDITRFRAPGAAGLVGRADPAPSRVRHHRAPRPDHQDGMWRPQLRLPCPRVVDSAGRSSCRSWVGSIFIELS